MSDRHLQINVDALQPASITIHDVYSQPDVTETPVKPAAAPEQPRQVARSLDFDLVLGTKETPVQIDPPGAAPTVVDSAKNYFDGRNIAGIPPYPGQGNDQAAGTKAASCIQGAQSDSSLTSLRNYVILGMTVSRGNILRGLATGLIVWGTVQAGEARARANGWAGPGC